MVKDKLDDVVDQIIASLTKLKIEGNWEAVDFKGNKWIGDPEREFIFTTYGSRGGKVTHKLTTPKLVEQLIKRMYFEMNCWGLSVRIEHEGKGHKTLVTEAEVRAEFELDQESHEQIRKNRP